MARSCVTATHEDTDASGAQALAQGMGVQACPTLVCWKHGERVEVSCAQRTHGVASKMHKHIWWPGHGSTVCLHPLTQSSSMQTSARGEGSNPATLMAMLDKHAGRRNTCPLPVIDTSWSGMSNNLQSN